MAKLIQNESLPQSDTKPAPTKAAQREAKRAAVLRTNLQKRKQQSRARASDTQEND